MTKKEMLMVVILIPVLIGGAIAVMILSYMLVPLIIVTLVVLTAIAIVDINRDTLDKQGKRK